MTNEFKKMKDELTNSLLFETIGKCHAFRGSKTIDEWKQSKAISKKLHDLLDEINKLK